MLIKLLLLIFLLFMTGCVSWEVIGITSTKTHNDFVDEIQEFSNDAIDNQARIIEITHDLNQESIYLSKKNDDMQMLERSVLTNGKIEHAKEVSKELSSREFNKAPEPSFDWSTIITAIVGTLTGGLTIGGGIKMVMKGKLDKLAGETRKFANSTEVNDVSHLKKYGV